MKKILSIIIVFSTSFLPAFSQEQSNDSLSLTQVTTTDFMQIKGGGRMNWTATYAARGFCLFGECGGGPSVAENHQCCKLGEFLIKIFGWLGGGGGDPTLLNNNSESGGGGGGGIGFIFIPYGPPGNPPIRTHFGGGGGAGPSNPFVTVVTPPPTNPVDSNGYTVAVKDCAGVKNGKAYKDSCGYCVGGTTSKDPCVCPTDSTFTITKDMLVKMNPSGNKARMDSVIKYMNLYMNDPDFQINTRLRLAHFLAQISAETEGFTILVEDYHYSKKSLLKKKKFFDSTNVDKYVNCECVFDKMYCCQYGNGDSTTTDGSRFRGRGLNQMTWKYNYDQFNKFYQKKYNDYSVNFVTNPELLNTNWKYAVIAALWDFCKFKKLNPQADADNILKYSKGVNCGNPNAKCTPNGLQKRKDKLALAKEALCL